MAKLTQQPLQFWFPKFSNFSFLIFHIKHPWFMVIQFFLQPNELMVRLGVILLNKRTGFSTYYSSNLKCKCLITHMHSVQLKQYNELERRKIKRNQNEDGKKLKWAKRVWRKSRRTNIFPRHPLRCGSARMFVVGKIWIYLENTLGDTNERTFGLVYSINFTWQQLRFILTNYNLQ